uniref:Tail specific protease domain-containing protein n=1 Tax=Psilocybe cubensis TaxID=181762 RepID=A0A8H8CIE2_PSICU
MVSFELRRLVGLLVVAYPLLTSAAPPPPPPPPSPPSPPSPPAPPHPPAAADPCAKIAGLTFVPPADALACYKAFPFNETLRDNVMTNMERVFDFFTFEDFYLNSPPPFQESTNNIRATLAKIGSTKFATDYDFNKALYDFTTQLNDGHTRYFPACYNAFQNILPAPVVSLEEDGVQNLFVAPDSVEFISLLGTNYTGFFDKINFDWKRLAGAKIVEIEGQNPYDYVDLIARTVSGNYLDHGVRVNSVFTSYRISGGVFGQRIGDLAGPLDVTRTSLNMKLITVNSTKVESVEIPYLADFIGVDFTDKESFWANNCAADDSTNGVDVRGQVSNGPIKKSLRKQPKADIIDGRQSRAINLPDPFLPTAPPLDGSDDAIKTFVLPDGKTGVMFVGTFSPNDFDQFQLDTVSSVNALKKAGVTQLIIDLTGNGGGFVCLGQFLHQFLAGSQIGYPGFESTQRANPLAQKIVAAHVALGNNSIQELFYNPTQWAFLNDTIMPVTFDYNNPSAPFVVNGKSDPTSQRFHDTCTESFSQAIPETPPFDLSKVAIVSNGNCASTCAMFSTLMFERHNTKIAVFGGKPGENVEFKGMAGNQVLEWADLDTEIKSVGLKDDPLAPPDLLVNSNFRHNWRTAWSFLDETRPIAYVSELPLLRFPYTKDTYNNPQNLWTFAATKLFT